MAENTTVCTRSQHGPPVLSYDIARAEHLYAADLRYDEEHLNAEGAQVWSRLFADDIVHLYRHKTDVH